MTTSQNVPELIAAAQAKAKLFEARIAAFSAQGQAQGQERGQERGLAATGADDLNAARVGLEAATVDLFTLFEARMQHHFRRGPFSRKLKAALLEAGQGDLAERVHAYYLAVNVLKHGAGASYRELLDMQVTMFPVHRVAAEPEEAAGSVESGPAQNTPSRRIDVSVPGFFDGLAATLLEAQGFLENR